MGPAFFMAEKGGLKKAANFDRMGGMKIANKIVMAVAGAFLVAAAVLNGQ